MSTFQVLSDETRRRLLDLLRQRPRSVADLTRELGTSQPGTSKHLKVLREAGMVEVTRKAQQRIYSVRPEPLAELDSWLTPYRWMWESRFDLLETELAADPADQATDEQE